MRVGLTKRPLFVVAGAALASLLLLLTAAAAGVQVGGTQAASASECPPGFRLVDVAELMVEQQLGGGDEGEVKPIGEMLKPMCLNNKHPEAFAEISTMQAQRSAQTTGGIGRAPRGAYRAALAQREALLAAAPDVPGADGSWTPLGKTPLRSDLEEYVETNGTGLSKLNGRIDSLDYDPVNKRLFASIGTGGVWMSTNHGDSWKSIGDSLPTQVIGAIAWSPAKGGTLVAVSGEPLMGGNTYTGMGAFYSRDLGKTWRQSTGIRDGIMGFQVEVDPSAPSTVYAATSMGLYRSTDAGATFKNVNLPVGDGCAGKTSYGRCQFANFVTDVVVKEPGGITEEPGKVVIAAVGYRAGMAQFPNGKVHAPGNGLYRSPSGKPGTFENLNAADHGFACQTSPTGGPPTCAAENIGRVELGNAVGKKQDHNYLYAIVQDAELFNGGVPSIDIGEPGNDDQALHNTALNGIYVSADFGNTWTQMADTAEIAENPTTHSGLVIVGQGTLFAPGVQAWYNMWIKPDPTQQTAAGVPTELTFGLEEVWKNRCSNPQNSANQINLCDPIDAIGDFEVVGPYFADRTCLLLDTDGNCATAEDADNPEQTTHPDQQDALYIPTKGGGSKLVVGNDGGAYVQDVPAGELPNDDSWGKGNNDGFHTLLPYSAEITKDGTVWFGLQDNGSGKITPDGTQIMGFGGDGFYVAASDHNSDYAWSETPGASMRVTTDGGRHWRDSSPGVTNAQFSNPFVMDPTDDQHLMTAGKEVVESVYGPDTQSREADVEGEEVPVQDPKAWKKVFDLGTNEESGATNKVSALDLQSDAAYVAFCGVCDVLNNWDDGFHNGIATNVGGDEPPERMTSKGWHFAAAKGLPNRYITSVAIDPDNPKTVFATVGGYANREWVPPGSYLDENDKLGDGSVFMSTDAGETFTNITGSLPNASAAWIETHGDQLFVGTDIGVFLSGPVAAMSDKSFTAQAVNAPAWAALDNGLPNVPISTIRNHPGQPDTVVVATFGRGVYLYTMEPHVDPPGGGGDPDPDPDPDGDGDVDDTGDGFGDGPVLPATGGGLALVGAMSMTLGALVVYLPGRRRRRR